jgi:putative acetyltransferase
MSPVLTRRALPEDDEEAVAVLRQSITELCVLDHQGDTATLEKWLSNKTQAQFARWLGNPDSRLLVALVGPAMAGVGALHRSGEIRLCYVRPGFTKMGVGRALLDALETEAHAWHLERVTLHSSLTARHFYERCGYVSAGDAVPGFGVSRGYPYAKSLTSVA